MKTISENKKPTIGKMTIGVLALQGDYELHEHQLGLTGAQSKLVRLARDLDNIDGLIIPGGESTTMNILIDRFEMRKSLKQFGAEKPVYGTCAGMIMLASEIEDNQSGVEPLGLIDISVRRNGYGRQVYSKEIELPLDLNGDKTALKAAFIRAPKVTRVGSEVTVLASFESSPVFVRQGTVLAASFHSELDRDTRLLVYFLNKIVGPLAGI